MANGVEISNAWKAWITSDAGKQASDPNSLGTTLSARNYLENRLHNAFMAGAEVAQGCGVGRGHLGKLWTEFVWEDSQNGPAIKSTEAIARRFAEFVLAAETSQSEESR